MGDDKCIDESWKEAVGDGKSGGCAEGCGCSQDGCGGLESGEGCGSGCGCGEGQHGDGEVNFFSYMTTIGYQAMIFLGELPNP